MPLSFSTPPEIIRKPLGFLFSRGYKKRSVGWNGLIEKLNTYQTQKWKDESVFSNQKKSVEKCNLKEFKHFILTVNDCCRSIGYLAPPILLFYLQPLFYTSRFFLWFVGTAKASQRNQLFSLNNSYNWCKWTVTSINCRNWLLWQWHSLIKFLDNTFAYQFVCKLHPYNDFVQYFLLNVPRNLFSLLCQDRK